MAGLPSLINIETSPLYVLKERATEDGDSVKVELLPLSTRMGSLPMTPKGEIP